jgi:multiple sugar transport system substrate-binding protein
MGANRKHFREAGLDVEKDYPKYWDDVISVGKKLVVTDGGRIVRQAMTFPYTYGAIWCFMELQPIIRSMGGSVMNADGTECLINSEAGIKAMEHLKSRFTEGLIDKDISTTMTYLDGFPNGEYSMVITSQELAVRWELANPEKMKGNIFIFMNPTTPGHDPAISVSSWAHSVYSKSKHKDWAWRLVDWLTKDAERNLRETGGVIPRKGWADTKAADRIPQKEVFAAMTPYLRVSGLTKDWTAVSEPIKRAMQEILYQNKDIRSTLNAVKKEVDNAIK